MEAYTFSTPLGPLTAIGDGEALSYLGFANTPVESSFPIPASCLQVEEELKGYFQGTLTEFKTKIDLIGTPFQHKVWEALRKIPFGKTQSYQQVAHAIDHPRAARAVGMANGANQFVILIPCHRVIQADHSLGGYSSGLERKRWLLDHESKRSHG